MRPKAEVAPPGPVAASAAIDLAKALIARRSVTPADGGCQDLLARRLSRSGFLAERHDRNGVSNLWLRRGTVGPLFVFAGHTDVVPTGPEASWKSDPFLASERDGYLFGRGAADMKTSLAAFAVAAEEYVARNPSHPGSIAMLLTSDEEGPAVDGTVAVVEALQARGDLPDFCLVGEPTCVDVLGDTVKTGRRGSLSGHLVVRGIQGHVAYPHLARNPIHEALGALDEMIDVNWDDGGPGFPPTSFQISNFHAGTGAGNVIPGACVIDFNLRFSPVSGADQLCRHVESILFSHELDFEIEWTLGARPFQCRPGLLLESLRGAIQETLGVQSQDSTTGGTSDGRFLSTICPEVVEFGPPNGSIHKIDECVRLADIDALKDVYRRTLELVLARPLRRSGGVPRTGS